jgi:outer membrane protein TolC
MANPSFLFLLGCALSLPLRAQTGILETYVQEGLSNNLLLKQQSLDVEKGLESLQQAKALFLPAVSFQASYTLSSGGRRIELPVGDLLNPVYSTLNLLTQTNLFPQIDNVSEQFLPNKFQETKVRFGVPVYNSELLFNQKIRKLQFSATQAQFVALERALKQDIRTAYFQLLQLHAARQIWQQARAVVEAYRTYNERLVQNGVATKEIVALAHYELAKIDQSLLSTDAQQQSVRAYFNFLLNKPLQSEVVVDTTVENQLVALPPLDSLLRLARAERHELKALDWGKRAAEQGVELQLGNRFLPKVSIGGEAGFQGFGYHWLDGKQAFFLVQAGLTYPIFQGGLAKSKVQEAKINLHAVQQHALHLDRQIALQVTHAYAAYQESVGNIDLASRGLSAAKAVFDLTESRYRQQQILFVELMEAQNRLTAARLQLSIARIQVHLTAAELLKITGI